MCKPRGDVKAAISAQPDLTLWIELLTDKHDPAVMP